MKKYIIFWTSILVFVFGFYYVNYYTSFYFSLFDSKIDAYYYVFDKNIIVNGNSFEVKGVNLSSSIPGYGTSEYKIDKETYLRWFSLIKEMNANTIRVFTIENTDFYEALYQYNSNNDDPLYLIQGIEIDNYSANSSVDAFDDSILKTMISDCKKMVDVIHGKRVISYNTRYASGVYKYDVSKWTLGYILGNNFESSLISFTNDMNEDKASYKGKYLYTSDDATPFERVLTEIGDNVLEYESNRYKEQRLISYEVDSLIDPLNYEDEIIDYFNKYAEVDLNNILTTNNVVSGMFASYEAYAGYPEYFAFSLEKYDDTYYEYVNRLNRHHDMPVVITNVGFSTSRGVSNLDFSSDYKSGNITEEEQGDFLSNIISTINKAGCNGVIIYEWADDWNKNSWNILHSVDVTRTKYWQDVQASSQGYGILSFDSSKVKYQDGNVDEWKENNLLYSDESYKLYGDYDEKYLYLTVMGSKDVDLLRDKFYIGLDITNKSGSLRPFGIDTSFSRPIDFYIRVDGTLNSEILVHRRYNVLRAVYQNNISGENPYENVPNLDTNIFDSIQLITSTQKFNLVNGIYQVEDFATVVDTGKLIYGNNNPNSADYVSNADFYVSNNNMEIRIPWSILNFGDPSTGKIHDDYYENYGVEFIKVKEINVGVGTSNVSLVPISLNKWGGKLKYNERLKSSYNVIKDVWSDIDEE